MNSTTAISTGILGYVSMHGVPVCALTTSVSRLAVLTIQSLELSSPLRPWDAIVPWDMA